MKKGRWVTEIIDGKEYKFRRFICKAGKEVSSSTYKYCRKCQYKGQDKAYVLVEASAMAIGATNKILGGVR